jgi:UDP-N-acetylmuramate dehydrogenase
LEETFANSAFEKVLREAVPLAPLTTLGIGGPARYFADATTEQLVVAGVRWAREHGQPLLVLGGGSNLLVADSGFPGLVLRVSIRGIDARTEGEYAEVTAAAGEPWEPLVAWSVARGWAGFECLSGIPGMVGATPIQNVGAYGQETSETLVSVRALDLPEIILCEIDAAECKFGYRTSRFKTTDKGRFIITRVTYRLRVGANPTSRYAELQHFLEEQGARSAASKPALAETRDAVLTLRRRKAMVIDAADPDSRSVGSFFVNPVVTPGQLGEVRSRAGLRAPDDFMPAFPQEDGRAKLSAAWLIERAGFQKGFVFGNVGISNKHALAIINRGGGTAREVVDLKNLIQTRVRDAFGIELVPEPVLVGFED